MEQSLRKLVVEVAELSDPGRDPSKQDNEDSSGHFETPAGHLAVVCDGMGGHAGGREASSAAVTAIIEHVRQGAPGTNPGALLRAAIEHAARVVFAIGGRSPADVRPGSTCVAVLLHERGAEIAHVGDSRVYLIRAGQIRRLTRDHSMVQEMVDAGLLRAEEALAHPDANKITRALGMKPDVEVELLPSPLPLSKGDVLLLATDGLTDMLRDDELLKIVQRQLASGIAVVCQELVRKANERGGHDNITAQLVRIVDTPARVEAPTLPGEDEPGFDPGALPTKVSPAHPEPVRARGGPPPTIVDGALASEPHNELEPARTTEPGPVPGAAPPRFVDADPRAPAGPAQARSLVWVLVLSCVAIGIAIALWWFARSVTPQEPEVPLPLAPSGAARPAPSPRAAPLEPDLSEEQHPQVEADAAAVETPPNAEPGAEQKTPDAAVPPDQQR